MAPYAFMMGLGSEVGGFTLRESHLIKLTLGQIKIVQSILDSGVVRCRTHLSNKGEVFLFYVSLIW
jgi:hypothetical protein